MRLPDWEARLAAVTDDRLYRPFEWGVNDCLMLARDVCRAITGKDPMESYLGVITADDLAYSTEKEAIATLTKAGHDGLFAAAAAHFYEKEPAMFASDGDIVGADAGCGETLGVFLGGAGRFITGKSRPMAVPRHQLLHVWATEQVK